MAKPAAKKVAKKIATKPVPHTAEVSEWDAQSFNAATIFEDAAVPEFVDPELLAQLALSIGRP